MPPHRLPHLFLPLLLLLLAFLSFSPSTTTHATTATLLHNDKSPSTVACPGTPFTIQFRIKKKLNSHSTIDWDSVQDFFWNDLPSSPQVFVTRTTTLTDLCLIDTLSVNDKSFHQAAGQAARAAKTRARARARRKASTALTGNKKTKTTILHVIVRLTGTPGIHAIKARQVSQNLQSLLLQKTGASLSIITTVKKGKPTVKLLKTKTNAAGLATAAGTTIPVGRTHTFTSYYSSPTFKSYTPVVIADADFKGDLSLDMVALSNGAVLKSARCGVSAIYRSPRKANDWTQLTGLLEMKMFTVHSTASGVRLGLNLGNSLYYYRLRGQMNLGKNTDTINAIQSFWASLGLSLSGASVVNRFSSQGKKRKERKNRRLDEQQQGVPPSSSSLSTPSPAPPTAAANQSISQEREDIVFHTDNYATADYANDYAILFKCPKTRASATTFRIDITLIPRVKRPDPNTLTSSVLLQGPPSTSLVCQPGNAAQGLSSIGAGVPLLSTSSSDCPSFPKRTAVPSRILDSATFEGLHPEEQDWVALRLSKTGAKLSTFVQQNLATPALALPRTDLKLAIAVSGGGKRSLFNAAGVTSALHKAGVLDLATWAAGGSGGSWLLGGVYAASLGQENLVDPAVFITSRLANMSKALFDGVFRANSVVTNFGVNNVASLPVAPFATQASAADTTDKIMCQAELKFQSAAVKAGQAGNPALAEYWSRALAYQFLDSNNGEGGGLGQTFSGWGENALLASQKVPLPLIMLQNNQGDGRNNRKSHNWEVSPFDIAVHKGDVHVSYPTALLGTDPYDVSKRCTTQFDQVSFLMGMSSWIFPGAKDYVNGTLESVVCGEAGSACVPVVITNPFAGYAGTSKQAATNMGADSGFADLFTATNTRLVDGAYNQNNPVWPFVTPTRKADVVIVIDSSGWEDGTPPPVGSTETRPAAATCASDVAAAGTSGNCASGSYYDTSSNNPAVNQKCCSACNPLLDFACWPTADPALNDLFKLSTYSPEHTLPSNMPRPGDPFVDESLLDKITFFGCTEVDKTAIVYIPNKIASSGKSGFTAIKSVVELNPLFNVPVDLLTSKDIQDIVKNGQDQLGGSGGNGASASFKTCLACLFYATLLPGSERATFWQSPPPELSATGAAGCGNCYQQYCYTRP